MDAASGAQVSTVRGAAKRAFGWARAGVRLFILSLIGALIVVVAREWDWWVGSASLQSTDDAYLRADTTPLAAKVPGYVRRVLVQDFQRVRAGNVLVEIVDDDYRAQLDQAQANVSAAEAAITNIDEQRRLQETLVKQAEAEIEASEADATRYRLEAVRQQTLLSQGIAGTPQLVEQAVDNAKRAAATVALNRAKLDQQRQQLNVLASQKAQGIASLAAQKAARDLATINLGYTRISAPVEGMVGERQVRPGQYLSVGTQVISLVPLPNVWVLHHGRPTRP
jgi:membrane fusion protein, multidrug efflux system